MKKNIVLIAAGGGNDVFSTLVYAKCMLTKVEQPILLDQIRFTQPKYSPDNIAIISLLGLTPFHRDGKVSAIRSMEDYNRIGIQSTFAVEDNIIIPDNYMTRYIVCNPPKEINCMERLLPPIAKHYIPGLNKYACLSTKYSAVTQTNVLIKQLLLWNMKCEDTLVMIVDFGGDILTDGKQSSIISPELDAFSLALGHNLHMKGYECKLTVCFPGVDGELPPDYLTNICQNFSVDTLPINRDDWKHSLNNIYQHIKNERPGNTIPNMLHILDHPLCNTVDIRKRWIVGSMTLNSNIINAINPELQLYAYVFDLPTWNPFVDIFQVENYNLKHVIDSIMTIYSLQDNNYVQSSDLHLQYLKKDRNGDWTNTDLSVQSDVMLVNIFPKCITESSVKMCQLEIEKMRTYNTLYR